MTCPKPPIFVLVQMISGSLSTVIASIGNILSAARLASFSCIGTALQVALSFALIVTRRQDKLPIQIQAYKNENTL